MARMLCSKPCWAKAVSLSKVLRSAGFMRAKIASMTEMGEPRSEGHAGFAFMENEHGPRALADDEVALPMADLGPGVDVLGPLVDGNAILDGISRRPRSARTTALVAGPCGRRDR